jgi:acetyltransferase-like isoleucine patch superfamily enzyme
MALVQFLFQQYIRLKNPTCTIHAYALSKQVKFDKHVTIEPGTYFAAKKIGKYSFIGINSYVDKSTASIGNFCSIAMNAKISLQNHPHEWVTTHPFTYRKKYGFVKENINIEGVNTKQTVIGNDVWIGANVTILAGVTIGNGAIIGANSLVSKDIEPYSIVSGTPARLVRYRFDEETIAKIQASQWWNWDDKKIQANLSKFSNTEAFLKSIS